MFRNKFQKGLISIFYSCGPSPLKLWSTKVKYGCIRRITDEEIQTLVLEIAGNNISTTFITCPKNAKASLGIYMPIMTIILKNMISYLTFEVTIKDDANIRRRFRFSSLQKIFRVKPFFTVCPISLHPGWNELRVDLEDMTKTCYCSRYVEVVRVQINANCRLKRLYFSSREVKDEDIPEEYRVVKSPKVQEKRLSTISKKTLQKEKQAGSENSEKIPWLQRKYSEAEMKIPMTSEVTSLADTVTYVVAEEEELAKDAKTYGKSEDGNEEIHEEEEEEANQGLEEL